LSQRFDSFGIGVGKRRPPHPQRDAGKRLGDATIPVADIIVVDMNEKGDSHRTNITTVSNGFFEFTLENRNGQEVLLAFLKTSLPKTCDGGFSSTKSIGLFTEHGNYKQQKF
jgi:hypothetical protein